MRHATRYIWRSTQVNTVMALGDAMELADIAFFGRTFDEYCGMFDLSPELLAEGQILDCPSGASSFAAEAHARGFDVTAADVLFDLEPEALIAKGRADLEIVMRGVEPVKHLFRWKVHKDIVGLRRARSEALARFATDYTNGKAEGRYVAASLPTLPFADNEFHLAISGHFLFLYGDRLDFDFHVHSLMELCRVASREVRIFPLLGLDARPYSRLDEVRQRLHQTGVESDICKVPYEFQRGGNQMLTLFDEDRRRLACYRGT